MARVTARRPVGLRRGASPIGWRGVVALAGLGVLPVALDSAVNIAFPAITRAFGMPVGAIQWVVIAYVLVEALLLLPAGWLADRLGHRRVFMAGLGLSALAFLACGLATGFGGLLAARGVQGIGAALVLGSAPALVTLAAPDAARVRALGWYNLAIGAGGVLGPLAGGLGVAAWGWRTVYLGRIPLAVLALALAWPRTRIAAPAAAAGPTGAWRGLRDPAGFARANAANLIANAALFFVWLLVPYYLVERRGLGSGPAGLLFAVGPLATALGAPLGGAVAARRRAWWLPAGALAVEAVGLGLVARLDDASPPAAVALAVGLAGLGLGLFTVPNMHYVMDALPPSHQGRAGSLVTLMRMGGILVGARGAASLYEHRLAARGGIEPSAFADTLLVGAALAALAGALSLAPPRAARKERE
jgi:MFS family permease